MRGAQRPDPHSPSRACGRGRGPLRSNGKVRGRSPTSPICRRGAAQRAFSGTTESSRSPHPPTLRVGPSHNPFDRSAIEPSRGRPQSGRPGCARKRERGLTDAVRIGPSPACGRGRGPLRSNGKVRGRMPVSLICRSSIAQRAQDGVLHAFGIAENVVVPEAQYPPPVGFEPRGPTRVDGAPGMLAAIRLDHEAMLDADEIGDERAEPVLATKLEAAQPATAQGGPQPTLGIGHGNAQFACPAHRPQRNMGGDAPSPSRCCATGPFLSRGRERGWTDRAPGCPSPASRGRERGLFVRR